VILELGSGTGVCGITAALCGAKHVILSDTPDPPHILVNNIILTIIMTFIMIIEHLMLCIHPSQT
jgi:predicted nicotinamide N-methyase